MLIIVSRDSCDVLDLLSSRNGNGNLFKAKHDLINSLLDASAKIHWVHSSSNRFAAFFEDSTGKNRRGSSSITSLVIGFAGNLLDEVGTDVVEPVGELNVLGYCHTILGDLWHSKAAVNNYVATTGSQGDLDGISEHIAALKHEGTGLSSELDVLASKVELLRLDKGPLLHGYLGKVVHAGGRGKGFPQS